MTADDRDKTIRLLTLILAGVWAVSLVVRIYRPDFTLGPALDSAVITVVGYWFSKEGLKGAPEKKAAAA